MPTRNINLTDYYDRFIEQSVAGGKYQNASEMVREALRLLEQRQSEDAARLDRLRAAAKAGFDSIDRGEYRDVDVRDIAEHVRSLGEQAPSRRKRSRSHSR
jgi:antitoxin ParD1/3/4